VDHFNAMAATLRAFRVRVRVHIVAEATHAVGGLLAGVNGFIHGVRVLRFGPLVLVPVAMAMPTAHAAKLHYLVGVRRRNLPPLLQDPGGVDFSQGSQLFLAVFDCLRNFRNFQEFVRLLARRILGVACPYRGLRRVKVFAVFLHESGLFIVHSASILAPGGHK
jgi:hypothetical protein